jgi:membrane protease YdiL (CAAX protease family)
MVYFRLRAHISVLISVALAFTLFTGLTPVAQAADGDFFSTVLLREPDRPRNYFLPPLISVVLPGFDQWWEGQTNGMLFYGGTAGVGLLTADWARNRLHHRGISTVNDALSARDNDVRAETLGSQLYGDAGFLSAYASFRSAVRSRRATGEFAFLTHEESIPEILSSPFAFSELAKPSTFLPLLVAAGFAVLEQQGHHSLANTRFGADDVAFAGGYSYLAGTTEEAAFRGWLMPALMQPLGNRFWSNTGTALVFASAHISSSNPVPLPQFLLGWYLGYRVQNNDWTLRQSIFIHAWWDAIVFTGTYLDKARRDRPEAWLRLPLLTVLF